jgi:hypothetical protein
LSGFTGFYLLELKLFEMICLAAVEL